MCADGNECNDICICGFGVSLAGIRSEYCSLESGQWLAAESEYIELVSGKCWKLSGTGGSAGCRKYEFRKNCNYWLPVWKCH